jgi:hypothetical protein
MMIIMRNKRAGGTEPLTPIHSQTRVSQKQGKK